MASSAGFSQPNLKSPSTTSPNQSYSMNGKIVISALVILFFIVFIIALLHMYAKWLRRSINLRSRLHHSLSFQGTPLTGGLDKEIVEALPMFAYESPCLSQVVEEANECAVCLSNFRQDEKCKLLPRCKHFFHTDCIGMWFLSNTTCPLCRTAAGPSDCAEGHDVAGSTSFCFTNQDGGNEQYQRAGVPTLGTRDSPLQSPTTSRNCRRSISEKFSRGTQDASLPTNVLFWGNHTHTTSHMNPTHWQTGGRSFSHMTIDIMRAQESLVAVSSCPALRSSPEPCSTLPHRVHRSVNEFKSLKRLPSNKL